MSAAITSARDVFAPRITLIIRGPRSLHQLTSTILSYLIGKNEKNIILMENYFQNQSDVHKSAT